MSPPSPMAAEDLSEAERFLILCVGRGEPADLKRHTIRAAVLRELILETHPGWAVREAGIRLHKVIIDGGLDLEGCTLNRPLLVWHSRFQGGGDRGAILLRDAKLKRLGIHSCTVEGGIIADRVEIENGLFLGGGLVKGVLQVRGASIDGALAIEGTEIGDGKQALLAAGLSLTGPLILRRAQAKGEVSFPRAELGAGIYAEDAVIFRETGAINGESAHIKGDILLDRAKITGSVKLMNATVGGQVSADGVIVAATPNAIQAQGLNVAQGINLSNSRIAGSVSLEGAYIGRSFRVEAAEIWGEGTSIAADVIRIGGNWNLARSKLVGQLLCPGAEINGQFRLTETRIFGNEIAVRADGTRVRGGCFLSRAITQGQLRFPASEIGNQFRLRGANLTVRSGAALLASGSTFKRDVQLNDGLQSTGALVFDQARIHGSCDLSGSNVTSVALARDGASEAPPRTTPADELSLSFVDAEIGRLEMPAGADHRPRGVVDLSRAKVGSYVDYAAAWPPAAEGRGRSTDGREVDHLVLDGFTYEHLGNPSGASTAPADAATEREARVGARRIQWLGGQDSRDLVGHFKPQAWMHLAHRLSAQGYQDDANTVTIARRRRERRSHGTTAGQRWQSRVLDLFALYGLNPWRTVIWMVVTILAFAGVWSWAAGHCTTRGCFDEEVFVVSNRDAYTPAAFASTYPPFNALAYSFDVFVPFISFGYEDHWRPNTGWQPLREIDVGQRLGGLLMRAGKDATTAAEMPPLIITTGGILYALVVVEMLIGLVLTSLAVTGFTGLLRSKE